MHNDAVNMGMSHGIVQLNLQTAIETAMVTTVSGQNHG
jgi:hypothetical protein